MGITCICICFRVKSVIIILLSKDVQKLSEGNIFKLSLFSTLKQYLTIKPTGIY